MSAECHLPGDPACPDPSCQRHADELHCPVIPTMRPPSFRFGPPPMTIAVYRPKLFQSAPWVPPHWIWERAA